MQRLTAELASGKSELAVASANLTDLENQLARALTAAGHCSDAYHEAPPAVRRQYNQGFFEKLYIDEDGSVQAADLNQPFAALLTGTTDAYASGGQANGAPRDTQTDPEDTVRTAERS